MPGKMLHRARHREPAMGAVVAQLGQRENGPVHDMLLRNLSRERHTGQTKRPSRCDDGLRTIREKEIAPASFTSWATTDGHCRRRCSWRASHHSKERMSSEAQRSFRGSSRRTPGPIHSVLSLRLTGDTFQNIWRRWLWVPAFAGTTPSGAFPPFYG